MMDDKDENEIQDELDNMPEENDDKKNKDSFDSFSALDETRDRIKANVEARAKSFLSPKKHLPNLGERQKVTPKNMNTGKNLLNNNTSIKKPGMSKLDEEKEKNNGKLDDQIKKNAVRKAATALAPGGKAAALAGGAEEVKRKEEEKKKKDSKNKEKNKKDDKKKKNSLSRNNEKEEQNENSNSLNILNNINLESSSKLVSFAIKNPVLALVIGGVVVALFLFIIILVVMTNEQIEMDSSEYSFGGDAQCGEFNMFSTTLSKSDFASKMKDYSSKTSRSGFKTLANNADDIYDISVKNGINPEVVVVRAMAEGYSPGASNNNYWGIGCTNTGGYKACKSYSSFDNGVLAYINILRGYGVSSLFDVFNVKHYSYIGSNWYSPGSASKGGCYYLPYINKYMSQSNYNRAKASCDAGTEVATTAEDQAAFSHYNMETMNGFRKNVFGIDPEVCSSEESGDTSVSGSGIGAKVAAYAVNKFDSFGYLYGASRSSEKYVDCSAVTYRSYKHFGIDISGSSAGQYSWCKNNGKMIKESELQAGDLLLKSNHVELYIGNGKRFGAHTDNTNWDNQVSVKPYRSGYFTSFCRPTK